MSAASTTPTPSGRRFRLATVGFMSMLAASSAFGAFGSSSASAAAVNCSALNDRIYHRVNPSNEITLLTGSKKEAATAAVKHGYTTDLGSPFRVSTTSAPGLARAYLMTNPKSGDQTWMTKVAERRSAISKYGYVNSGIKFYVSRVSGSCTVPVYRYVKDSKHAYATTAAQRSALAAAGWKKEGITFYAGKPISTPATTPKTPIAAADADGKFSIAVYPDTQQEVFGDSRFIDRTQYLVGNRNTLDLRFVTTSGDNVNWDTPSHDQYQVAQKAFVPLETAKIPYSLSIGNHDTNATGVGGAARDPRYTRPYQRDTSTFNAYFNAGRYGAVAGQFEAGKVDNIYSTFSAGGKKWLVLNLELWPRVAAVNWAKSVVAAHPKHNVVIASHHLISGDGSIAGGAATTRYQYGDANPRYVYDNLILAYPNVKVTLSGHVGRTAQRTDTGKAGNKVVSYLTTLHSNHDNPTRLIEFNVKTNAVTSKVIGIKSGTTYAPSATTSGLAFK